MKAPTQTYSNAIHELLAKEQRIDDINEIVTLHMGPNFVIATISVDFSSNLTADQVEAAVTEINAQIKQIDPRLRRVFIEAESVEHHARAAPLKDPRL